MEASTIKQGIEITIKEEPNDTPASPLEREFVAPVFIEEDADSPPAKRKTAPIKIKEEVEESNEEQSVEITPNSAYRICSISRISSSSSTVKKALSKDETRGLLNLILMHPIITSRETNATYNYQKIIEWNQITEEFNSTYSLYPRTSKQLRLKWDNMKKNARKRNAKIRANRGKTENAEYIPRDEILDKVYALLRRRPRASIASHDESDDPDEILPLVREGENEVLTPDNQEVSEPEPSTVLEPNSHNETNGFLVQPPRKKKKKDEGREARNRAMAAYYEAKTKLIDANLINIKLQNEKLRLEIDILKRNKIK